MDKGPIPYNEILEFKLIKTEPALVFNVQQFTKHAQKGTPMHAENGFLKVMPDGKCLASYSHPFNLNEYEYGSYEASEGCYQWSTKAENPEDF